MQGDARRGSSGDSSAGQLCRDEFWRRRKREGHPAAALEEEKQRLEALIRRGAEEVYTATDPGSVRGAAKEELLHARDYCMPRLEDFAREGISELVFAYADEGSDRQGIAATLTDRLFGAWLERADAASATVLTRAVRAHLDDQLLIKRDGRLRLMDNGQHALAEHPLQVAQRVSRFGAVPLSWILTAILHDDNEDVQFRTQQGPIEEIIRANEERLKSILSEGLDAATQREVNIGISAVERVTLRRVADYEMELEHIEHEPATGEHLAVIAAAYATKLNDKGAAVTSTDYLGAGLFGLEHIPLYSPIDELSQQWKALSICNLLRHSLRQGALQQASEEWQELLSAMSVQTALDLWKTITTQREESQQYFLRTYELVLGPDGPAAYRAAVAQNRARCNEYIRRGGIAAREGGDAELDELGQDFGKLFFFLRLHKMDPKRKKNIRIPPSYRRVGEGEKALVERLDRDLSRFKGALPYTNIRYFTSRLLELPRVIREKEFAEEMPLYLRLDRHELSLRQAAERFALNPRALLR